MYEHAMSMHCIFPHFSFVLVRHQPCQPCVHRAVLFSPLRWRRCQPLKKFNCFDMPWIPWVSQQPRRHLATGPNWRGFWVWNFEVTLMILMQGCEIEFGCISYSRMFLASIFGQYLAMLQYSRYSRLEMTRVNSMKRFTCLFPLNFPCHLDWLRLYNIGEPVSVPSSHSVHLKERWKNFSEDIGPHTMKHCRWLAF